MKPTDEQINAAIDLLRGDGFSVTKPTEIVPWETPGEFQRRLEISAQHFSRMVSSDDCPSFIVKRGNTGRILKLQSNPELEAFILRNKKEKK